VQAARDARVRLLQHARRKVEEGLGGGKLGRLFCDASAELGLDLARDLADDVVQGLRQGGDVRLEDGVRQVEAWEELLAIGDLGQVAVRGEHDAAERVGRALLGALLLE